MNQEKTEPDNRDVRAENTVTHPHELRFRLAKRDDVPTIINLLADDPLGRERERTSLQQNEPYWAAFDAIENDANNELIVGETGGTVIAVLQLTLLPSMTYQGAWRAQIEGVRVAPPWRAGGVGRQLLAWAIQWARSRNCRIVQLTTDKRRPEAIRFYQALGFVASHEGMKLHLAQEAE